jgi:site-specific DNA-adenine methylase
MVRCSFSTFDVFEFLTRCEDADRHAIYCDPPFPGPGDEYRHKFTIEQHRQLAMALRSFSKTRVVCRFYDHPLIREIYAPGSHTDTGHGWNWRYLKGRTQANDVAPEVLIINGPSLVEANPAGLFQEAV